MALIRALLSRLAAEPALTAAVASIFVAGAARFGFDLSADQIATVLAALAGGVGLVVRQLVTPTSKAMS